MNPPSVIILVLVLTFSTSSLSAPIPVSVKECSSYASCSPFRSNPPQRSDPHFPTHQLESSKHDVKIEVKLLEPLVPPEPPIKNQKLSAVLKAARIDRAISAQKPLGYVQDKALSAPTAPARPKTQTEIQQPGNSRCDFRASSSVLTKVEVVATECSSTATLHVAAEGGGGGKKKTRIITYTYGYRYMRTDYTSILVVSIVVIFILAVVVMELLEKVLEGLRALFRMDQGGIRLEDSTCDHMCHCHCEKGDLFEEYTPMPKPFKLMPAPPPRSARAALPRIEVEEKPLPLETETG